MSTGELGLTLAQQLLRIDDLHYGYWDGTLSVDLGNLPRAQQKFNELILAELPPSNGGVRVLDVGCGTGHLLLQMLRGGYTADAVLPAEGLMRMAKHRLEEWDGRPPTFYESRFEDLREDDVKEPYDVVLFSESFQYVPLKSALEKARAVLRPGGLLLICDFFKTAAHGDGGPGDRSFGGGHALQAFYDEMSRSAFVPVKDVDITPHVSPNLDLVNELLVGRVKPATATVDDYLRSRYPVVRWLVTRVLRRKLEKINYKYLSGHRSKAVFERYKSYRLLKYRAENGERRSEK
jgi:SAM-dependent methyltransferase